ncbi:MAG TPA: glycosyltransferase [Bacteroidales bacterium]|nr:glycosyltransferase [Bacteroidales bacterium]
MITALTINYNTPELLERLLSSFRKHYTIPYIIIDGSDSVNYDKIIGFKKKYEVKIIHFPFNIHHGPGMAFGFKYIRTHQILLLDSDVIVIRAGFLEDLKEKLKSNAYGIGDIQIINERGMNAEEGIKYLHPACALLNRNMVLKFSLPILHGAPMINAMKEIHKRGLSDKLLIHEQWITNDFRKPIKKFIIHDWQGTILETDGYHYEEAVKQRFAATGEDKLK